MVLISFTFFPTDAPTYEVEVETFNPDPDKVAGLIQEVRAQHGHECVWTASFDEGPDHYYDKGWAPAWAQDPKPTEVEFVNYNDTLPSAWCPFADDEAWLEYRRVGD